jgi:hypothetical protein
MSYSDECKWHGILCDQSGGIIKLNLTDNGLQGEVPSELALLSDSLLGLDLSLNGITNSFEGLAFMGDLTKLKLLNIEETFVASNGMPTYISKLTDLGTFLSPGNSSNLEFGCLSRADDMEPLSLSLDLSVREIEILAVADTLISGALNGSVFEPLTRLRYVDLGGNEYNSSLPKALIQLPNLEALYASDCGLEGEIQKTLTHTINIHELWLDDNDNLSGTIPADVGKLTKLVSLSMTNSKIGGTIPTEMGKLTNMRQMWLYGNWLSGSIPSELGLLTAMEIFGIEDNNITNVSMPKEICDLNMLALSSDCGGDTILVDCNCCTCCEAPCPVENLPIYGNRYL